jgi:DNA-directed RNA polymerase I, II, and III subunit RPABC3
MAPAAQQQQNNDSSSIIKYEAMFETIDQDPDGKKFDRVSRFVCRSTPYGDSELTLDVNVDAYPIDIGAKFTYVLASTLNTDGSPEDPTTYDQSKKESLADEYEYVMHGKCYKKTEEDDAGAAEKTATYISFGGLLACVKTDAKAMSEVDVDDRVYCLMRKIA